MIIETLILQSGKLNGLWNKNPIHKMKGILIDYSSEYYNKDRLERLKTMWSLINEKRIKIIL